MELDRHKLRSLVFDKTGVRVDLDDPIFALVVLNEAVLAEAVERHVALIEAASAELAMQARAAGGLAPMPPAPAGAPAPASLAAPGEARLLAAAAGIALLSALLVLGGQALFFKPAPVPAPVIQARELTPEQVLALRNGEKLSKAIQKLDPRARNLLQAEMQK